MWQVTFIDVTQKLGFDNIFMVVCLAHTSILYTHSISVTKNTFDDGCKPMGVESGVVACTSLGAGC